MFISDNSPVRKNYFDSNIIRIQGYCDVYKWTILKRTSPEVKCLHLTSLRREMCTLSVSNVIYHKFSHGAAFYTLNGKNVNVMSESTLIQRHGVEYCKTPIFAVTEFWRYWRLRRTLKCRPANITYI